MSEDVMYPIALCGTRAEWLHFCRWLSDNGPPPKIGAGLLAIVPGFIAGRELRDSWEKAAAAAADGLEETL